MKEQKKTPTVDEDPYQHHVEPIDYIREEEKAFEMHCPQCAKARKHRHLVETEGEGWECPECHLLLTVRRV